MTTFQTTCGHYVVARPIQKTTGSQAGRWRICISGPNITNKRGISYAFSDPNRAAAITEVAAFLKVDAESLVQPPARPDILIGFDVETNAGDSAHLLSEQYQHFQAGHPCGQDHREDSGHVCAVGFAVFRRRAHDSNEYVAEGPVVTMVKRPIEEQVAEKASNMHGYTDSDCATCLPFSAAIAPILRLLQEGAQMVCHNLAHKTLVICREVQNLSLPSANPFLESLYSGHDTSIIAQKRNYTYIRQLAIESRNHYCQEGNNLGYDAAECARLFLHYNEAIMVSASSSAEPPVKKSRVVAS